MAIKAVWSSRTIQVTAIVTTRQLARAADQEIRGFRVEPRMVEAALDPLS